MHDSKFRLSDRKVLFYYTSQFGDGYFVQYLAPSTLAPIPKNILFILDSSGTMGGTKLEQTKNAMGTILGDLRRNDR